jgi:hypothetical protein
MAALCTAGGDLVALAGHRQGQAGEHSTSIDPDGTSAAGALVASLLRAGQVEVLAQRVEQADSRLKLDRVRGSVDCQGNRLDDRTANDDIVGTGPGRGPLLPHRVSQRVLDADATSTQDGVLAVGLPSG